MSQNNYDILNISSDATVEEIKRAFREKVKKLHPDKTRNPKDSEAFQCTIEAYRELINLKTAESSKNYPKSSVSKKRNPGKNLIITLSVSMEEILNCATKNIVTNRKGLCNQCGGTGSIDKRRVECLSCAGSGVDFVAGVLGSKKKCKKCNGLGSIPAGKLCPNCFGSGLVQEKIKSKIALNQDVFFSGNVILPGLGNYSPNGLPGNLKICLDIKEDPIYKINGLDIIHRMNITPSQAILGETLSLNIFGRKIKIKIPAGTQDGDILETYGAGLTGTSRKGNLKTKFKIKIPAAISNEEKKLYEKILAIEKGDGCLKILSL